MLKLRSFVSKILCLVLCIFVISVNVQTVKADEDIVKELKKEILPLKTVEPKDDLKDLMPLKEILKDKTIVGMGEATHSTSEFFKMKHRVFKFLVEEMGFRAFAIEANFGEGEILNDYILNDNIDELTAMNTFEFGIWRTDEVKEMLNWMKEYNLKAKDKDKIRFYGFDMQYVDKENSLLDKYFKKVSPELGSKFQNEKITFASPSITKEAFTANKENLNKTIKAFKENKEEMIKKSSEDEYELMLKNLDIIGQCLEFRSLGNIEQVPLELVNFRDKYMAENVKWIVDREKKLGNSKVMLWAHNGHISKTDTLYSGDNKYIWKRLGFNLDEMYKENYYALGFEFFKGRFNANGEYELKESNEKTLGYIFNKLYEAILYFDIKKSLNNNIIKNWIDNNEVFINNIGAVYNTARKDSFINKLNAYKDFDGLIFINETTTAKTPIYNLKKKSETSVEKQVKEKNDKNNNKLITRISLVSIGAILIIGIIYKNKRKNISK